MPFFLLIAAVGCTDPLTEPPGGGDDDHGVSGGPVQWITVDTPTGEQNIPVVDVDGDLVAGGDMVVLTREQRSLWSNPRPSMAVRWTGQVPYELVDPGKDVEVYEAIRHIEQWTPVRFRARTALDLSYIRITVDPDAEAASTSQVGKQYNAPTVITLDGSYMLGATTRTVVHELLHALGMYHEQEREDRDDFIVVNWECIDDDDNSQFEIEWSGAPFGPYDFRSIMHYASDRRCAGFNEATGLCPLRTDGSNRRCLSLERLPGVACPAGACIDGDNNEPLPQISPDDGFAEFVTRKAVLSPGDVNALYAMFNHSSSSSEADDHMGQSVASGDFDDDGWYDLAVGVPSEAPGSDPESGVVMIYKGTPAGLAPVKWLSQETPRMDIDGMPLAGLGGNNAGDRFGEALAVGDFNDDGIDDLAVGAPYEDQGTASSTGVVFVFTGSRAVAAPDGSQGWADARVGLQPWLYVQQPASSGGNESGDHFGAALAAGNFDGVAGDDLAVGIPDENWPSFSDGGAVVVFHGTSSALGTPATLLDLFVDTGDHFGTALAAGNLDNDAVDELVVGTPGDDDAEENAGASAVYQRNGATWTRTATQSTQIAGAALGSALAVGDFNEDGIDDLAVGAPFVDAGIGVVYVYRGRATQIPTPVATFTAGDLRTAQYNDHFGAALAAGDFDGDGDADLVVGAPSHDLSGAAHAGGLFIYRGTPSGGGAPTAWSARDLSSLATPASGDLLATAVAILPNTPFTGGTIVAGAPHRDVDGLMRAGVVASYKRVGPLLISDALIDQDWALVWP